jgi:Acetyltransferase (GNAT) domain
MNSVTTLADETGWLETLRSICAYDSYHIPAYQRLAAGASYATVLLSYESRGVRAAIPLTLRPLPDPVREATGYAVDATSVYGYPGPLRTSRDGAEPVEVDDSWRTDFVAWFTGQMSERRVLTAFIRTNPLLDASDMFTSMPFVFGPPTPTVAIDLIAPREDRLRQSSSHHRRALRKSSSNNLTFLRDHSDSAIAGFTSCYLQTMGKHQAGQAYLLDEARVAELLDGLGEHLELWVARKPDGVVASAGLFLRTNGIIQYHLGGTRSEDYALGAARPLFEAVADSGHERGDRWLHLGGGVGGDDDSLLRFKAGFGPDRFEYRTIRAVFDEEAYGLAAKVTGAETSNGFFPAYRTSGMGV